MVSFHNRLQVHSDTPKSTLTLNEPIFTNTCTKDETVLNYPWHCNLCFLHPLCPQTPMWSQLKVKGRVDSYLV